MNLNKLSRAELMGLPRRDWNLVSDYDSLLILSTRQKHDSGWAMMAIIGVDGDEPKEIAAEYCDDIEWKCPPPTMYGGGIYSIGQIRMDCCMRSGALHFWRDNHRFQVGCALSSIAVTLIQRKA